jgi:hypothetical protein
MIGLLSLLVFAWLLHGHHVHGRWSLGIPTPRNADVRNGAAPVVRPDAPSENKFLRWIQWVLNNI